MAKNVTPTSSSSVWTNSQDISRSIMLDSTKSKSKESINYSTSSSEDEYHYEEKDVISAVSSHGKTSSGTSCNITQTMDVTRNLEIMKPEHDLAKGEEEAIQTQQTLNAVIEAIHILTRQLKKTSDAPSSSPPAETMTTTHDFQQASPQEEQNENSTNLTGRPAAEIVRNQTPPNNDITGGGAAGSIVAAYATTDTWRFSEIVKQCFTSSSSSSYPEGSKIGSCLIALDDACRSLEQKAKWMSDESSMILQDLQQAQAELNEVDFRCHRAEKCAKQLYKQNLVLKKELEKSKAEKRVLVREIRALIGEKEDREAFQKRLVENMKAHEDIMIEQAGSLSSKRNGGVGELGDTGEVAPEAKNTDNNEGTQQSRTETATTDRTTTIASNSRFNPFGKLFQSFSGSMEITDLKEKTSNMLQSGPTAAQRIGSRDHVPTTPNTNHSTIYSPAAQLSMSEESPTLSTILGASQSLGSEYSYDTPPVLQLTPTLSSCDSMKSALSASDLLNSNDDGEEFNQNYIRESKNNKKTMISHRKKGSSTSSSTWVRQVNAVNSSTIGSSTQKTVISVKLPRKNLTRQSSGINSSRNTNSNNVSNGVITRSFKESDEKRTTKQFRQYTNS
jgi:hypothetical protein